MENSTHTAPPVDLDRLGRCWVVIRRELFGSSYEILGIFDNQDAAFHFLKSEDDGIEEYRMESHKIISANDQGDSVG